MSFSLRGEPSKAQSIQSQQGQALILGLAIMAVLITVLLSLFNYGRLLNTKAKQLHTVDAAAYSGALIQSRALNMQSHINLAQIGHQVAMAHLVSLASWAKFSATESRQYVSANPPSYLIGMMFGADHQNAYAASRRATSIMSIAESGNELAQRFSRHDEIVHQVLLEVAHAIQDNFHSSRDAAIQAVLAANFPNTQVTLASDGLSLWSKDNLDSNELQWHIVDKQSKEVMTAYKPEGNYRSLIASVIDVYKFLDDRSYQKRNAWPVSKRCPHLRHELRRQGSTSLGADGVWQSMDTQSFHALRSNRWIGCYFREYPMGWGWVSGRFSQVPDGFEYTDNPPDNFSSQDFWRWVRSATQWDLLGRRQNPLANSRAVQQRIRWQGGGFVPYLDINRHQQESFGFDLSIQGPRVADEVMTVSASAESFFERYKARRDGRREHANLWHPYWLARLVNSSASAAEPSAQSNATALLKFQE